MEEPKLKTAEKLDIHKLELALEDKFTYGAIFENSTGNLVLLAQTGYGAYQLIELDEGNRISDLHIQGGDHNFVTLEALNDFYRRAWGKSKASLRFITYIGFIHESLGCIIEPLTKDMLREICDNENKK